jgi:hypothetical protein
MAAAKKAKPKPKKAAGKKTRTEEEYQELRKATVALANCAVLTLGSNGKIGAGSGMMIDLKTKEIRHWSTQFFDALDMVGISYDREKYFEKKRKR